MTALAELINDLVIANRILAHEGIVDAYGHVSVRHPEHPDRYLLSRSLSPENVLHDDICEFTLAGEMIGGGRKPYLERFIHGALYEARPEVGAVVHSHALDVLPFSVSSVPLRPVIHTSSHAGADVPVWDIRDRFGDTNLLVANMDQGRDLAVRMGEGRAVLMRGHGFTAAGRTLQEVLKVAIYLPKNARVLMEALKLGGEVTYVSAGEIALRDAPGPGGAEIQRAWDYWARRAGCGEWLKGPPAGA
jgi:HCOMODA/2-hydroxy-3-carboxy-muconic semialdehyde decarboxylase